MASTCKVYKHGILLGSGSIEAASASITSWTAGSGLPAIARRNVEVQCTQAGVSIGKSFRTRILADNGSGTLTMADKCPFVGA